MVRDPVVAPVAGALRFDAFALDPSNALLLRGDTRLDLAPKAFAVLCHLAARPGQLVTKDELLDAVWGHRFVSESVLKSAVNAIRGVLDDDARAPRLIETVSRRGYRFIAPVTAAGRDPRPDAGQAPLPGMTAPEPDAPLRGMAARPPAVAPADPCWVGREGPLAQLVEALAAVQAVHGDGAPGAGRRLVLVGGEAGIGKTMLLERFAATARAADVALASGQCVEPLGGGEPLLPVLDALASLVRGRHGAAWAEGVRQHAPTWNERLPWLGGHEPPAPLVGEPERMLREFGALLDAATAARPVVLLLEDLHWSDHATVQLLGYLARRRGSARWLIVGSFRPTDAVLADHPLQPLRLELRAQRLATELLLDAFSEREVDLYLRQRHAPAAVARCDALARGLLARTEGLPMFVTHLVDELVAAGLLAPGDDGTWALADDAWDRLAVPDTIAGLVERQIARLPGPWRALLEAAAVVGQEFAHDVLAQVLDEQPEALRPRLDSLARRGVWLAPAGLVERADGSLAARYAFRHAVYQRVLHERAGPAQALQQHLDTARALERLAPHPAELARHHEAAWRIARASGLAGTAIAADARRWRRAAADEAQALQAPADAIGHLDRLLALAPPPAERARALAARGEAWRLCGRADRARADGDAALAAALACDDAALADDVRLDVARLRVRADEVPAGLALVEALLAGPAVDDRRAAARWLVKAEAQRRLGQAEAAEVALKAALARVPAEDAATRVAVLGERVLACFHRGASAEGLTLAREAEALCGQLGRAADAARMRMRAGVFAQALDRRDEALALFLDARERLHRLGDVDGERGTLLNLVKLYTDEGDAERALPLLQAGWALADGFESPVAENAFLQGFYYCHVLRGELGEALADARRVLAGAEGLHELYGRVGAAVLVSDLHLHLGDRAEAGRLVDGALAALSAGGELALWPRVTLRRAWLDLLEGEPARALERLDRLQSDHTVEQQEDAVVLARLRAQAWLALGDAAQALAAVGDLDGAPTLEAWALVLAGRLQARCLLGEPVDGDLARADALLCDRRLPAVEGLLLRRAVIDALSACRRADEAARLRADHDRERARIAATLAAWPSQRQAWEQAMPPLGAPG